MSGIGAANTERTAVSVSVSVSAAGSGTSSSDPRGFGSRGCVGL